MPAPWFWQVEINFGMMCIQIYIFMYIYICQSKSEIYNESYHSTLFFHRQIAQSLWFFTQPICALSCDLLLFPARCRHDLDRPTVPWRRPPRNLPRIVEFPTIPSKNHTTKFMEKRPALCFSSVSLFFPFPGAQKKRSRSLVIKLVKL